MRKLIIAYLLLAVNSLYPQSKKQITLEEIWRDRTFSTAAFSGFNSMKDGISYSQQEKDGTINKYDLKTGNKIGNIVKAEELKTEDGKLINVESYSFSEDESKLLLGTGSNYIYRRSSTGNNYVFDLKTRQLKKLSSKEKQMFPSFSPIGNKIAFVHENNIFIKNLDTDVETQVTTDGETNKVKNGWSDWVYEEEFGIAKNFFWNRDGSKLAFVRFDESKVKEYEMPIYNGLYPEQYKFKYPKCGEANSEVAVMIYDLVAKATKIVDIGNEKDIYIPRIGWSKDPNVLSVQRMNRLQNKLELLFADASSGLCKTILTEEAKTYIDVTDDLVFLEANKGFIWSSERDNYNHLYHYDMNGKLINQISKGNWDVIDFKGYDESSKLLYYTSTEVSAIDRDVYSITLDGKTKKKLSVLKGTTNAEFSKKFNYYVSTWSDINTPTVYELHSADGKLIKVLEDNMTLKEKMKNYDLTKCEFFSFKTSENIELNGWMMKPVSFDPAKKYPVFMHGYCGPGSNRASNNWDGRDFFWYQLLCQNGYIVVCVDGRGTLGRGREFKHSTYMQLGKLETIDQIEVAKYLGQQNYVDKNRIGFQGWSFGGYMASLLITKGADYFKAAIAVAPVTNWRYYDNIYTERFLRTPQENPKGYDENSPINFVKNIKGNYLLIHGSGDDNVHLQNTMEMTKELVKNNIPFDQFIYTDKNHGISGGLTRLHLYTKMLKFVRENI